MINYAKLCKSSVVLNVELFFHVLGESFHITFEYLAQEAKITSAVSRVGALESEYSKLKRDLITAMDEANTAKEKAKSLGDNLRAER